MLREENDAVGPVELSDELPSTESVMRGPPGRRGQASRAVGEMQAGTNCGHIAYPLCPSEPPEQLSRPFFWGQPGHSPKLLQIVVRVKMTTTSWALDAVRHLCAGRGWPRHKPFVALSMAVRVALSVPVASGSTQYIADAFDAVVEGSVCPGHSCHGPPRSSSP